MKTIILLFLMFAVANVMAQTKPDLQKTDRENQTIVDESPADMLNWMFVTKTKNIYLFSSIKKNHRLFGYAAPDVKSLKLVLFSVFTNDVKGNPFQCKFGSYYETSATKSKGFNLKFIKITGDFAEMELRQNNKKTKIYFLKKYIKFDQSLSEK